MTDKIKLKPFDAAEFLDDAESQAAYLSEALETGDAGYVAHAIGTIARARGMGELARITGLNRQSLYAALAEGGNPTLDTLLKVLSALDMELSARTKELEAA